MKEKDKKEGALEEELATLRGRVAQLQASELRLKLIEGNLRKSEERFRMFAEFTYDWEAWKGPDGRYIYVSPSCERITGYLQEEFMLDPELLLKITHPLDKEKMDRHLRHHHGEGEAAHLDFRIISRSGEVRWISHFCQSIYGKEESWLGRRASNRDITARKQVEEELRRVNRALGVLSESRHAMTRATNERELFNRLCGIIVHLGGYRLTWVGLVLHDTKQTVMPVAQAGFEEGYLDRVDIRLADPERSKGPTGTAILTGKPYVCKSIPTDPQYEPWREEASKRGYGSSVALPFALGGETVGALNIYAAEPDAFSPEEMELLTQLADDLAYGLGALRNRRERERAEAALLKNSEKVKMFAYSISHDLKNPAVAIHGLARLLHKNYVEKLGQKGLGYCEQIMKAAEHLASLVEMINLYVSAKEVPLTIERVRLKDLIRTVRDEFSLQLSERGIAWLEPERLPELHADRLSMTRVFRNLVDNALKYGGKGLSEIRIGYRESAGFHIVSVEDNGVGLREEDAKTIFRPFKKKKSGVDAKGTGLGLAIVKEIAERHGGNVWLEPETAKGTAFHVSISKSLESELPGL